MDIRDVATLDDAYESCDSWMGQIVCPYSRADGEKNMVDLLQKGRRFSFYKLVRRLVRAIPEAQLLVSHIR